MESNYCMRIRCIIYIHVHACIVNALVHAYLIWCGYMGGGENQHCVLYKYYTLYSIAIIINVYDEYVTSDTCELP